MSQCELVFEISEDIAKVDLVRSQKMDKAESSSKNSFTLGVGGVGTTWHLRKRPQILTKNISTFPARIVAF
jgi:hypothetical protein